MGGQHAILGYEYQFLRTLEYALSAVTSDDPALTGIQVEQVLTADLRADQDIVDFALTSGERTIAVAQVKSGGPDRLLNVPEVMAMLLRLLSHSAERYLVVTNRPGAPNLHELVALIRSPSPNLRGEVLSLVGRSRVAEDVSAANGTFWEKLRRTDVEFDTRDIEQVRDEVQELVRHARHRVAPSTTGWDAVGLLTGYLVWEVMAKAAGPHGPELPTTELLAALRLEPDALKALMPERDWAVHVTPAPRATDIARPELLARIAEHLPIPVPRDSAPVCLLAGMSGIGKSSLAVAWADDNAYAYATIMWIDAASQSQIQASFAAVAEWLQAKGLINQTRAGGSVRQKVFAGLARSAQPWLMVFDNCPDTAIVREWIPPRGFGHTIVTSTDQTRLPGPASAKVDVLGMTDTEGTRLLARRVLGDRHPGDNELQLLQQLALRLHHWPLALELAASYLVSTLLDQHSHDLAPCVNEFEHLLNRAMDDRPSVPLGYPETVVGAIALTWQRVADRTGPAQTLAANALRTAAFLASRQIPLHLLLSSWTDPPSPVASDNSSDRRPRDTPHDLPVGEIYRALKRDSLVTADEPFPMPTPSNSESAEAPGPSVTMNDIVQLVVRSMVDREGQTADVLFRVTYCTQAWLQFCSTNHKMRQAAGMLGHAIELSEHAIELAIVNKATALLWGNTAGILGYLDEWAGAARYLSAELAYLNSAADSETPLLRAQALVLFAEALYQIAEHPRYAVHQIIAHLEQFIADLNGALYLHHDAAAQTIRAASATVRNLLNHHVDHPRLMALASTLNDYRRMIPTEAGVDWFDELTQLYETIKAGRDAEARAKAETILADMTPAQPEYTQVLRMLAESCVGTRDWPAARDIVARFAAAARSDTLRRSDIALLVRNIGTSCVFAMAGQELAAFELFEAVNCIAEIADHNGVVIQVGDRDVIAVLRALRAYLNTDRAACMRWLDQADPAEIDSVEPTGIIRVIRRLLHSWSTASTRPQPHTIFDPPDAVADHTYGTSRYPVPDTVLPLHDEHVQAALVNLGAESAPARAVGSVQVQRASGRPPREPMEVAVETCLALRILGLPAEVAEVFLQVLRDGNNIKLTDPERLLLDNPANAHASRVPHHVAWVTSSGHLVDPVVPQLYALRAVAKTRPAHRHPVVLPFPPAREVQVLRRDGLIVAYQHLGTYDVRDLAKALSPNARAACETSAIFVALQALMALVSTGSDYISTIENAHPELVGLIIRPQRLGQ